MNKREFKKKLAKLTGCTIQHGWSCNTCFHAIKLDLKHDIHEYWLSVLGYRGDYNLKKYPECKPKIELLEEMFDKMERVI
jgi:hypothetical protein